MYQTTVLAPTGLGLAMLGMSPLFIVLGAFALLALGSAILRMVPRR